MRETHHEQIGANDGAPSLAQSGVGSFLDMEESDPDSSYRRSEDVPILQRSIDTTFDRHSAASGVSLGDLVDRLLRQPMSRADLNFVEIFLCLYRKFAAPHELFGAITSRFQALATDRTQHFLTRISSQLRICVILTRWLTTYPGDFASTQTSQALCDFLDEISQDPAFESAVSDMRSVLRLCVAEDDDTRWEHTDDHAVNLPVEEPEYEHIDSSQPAEYAGSSPTSIHSDDGFDRAGDRYAETVSVSSSDGPSIYGIGSGLYTFEDYELEAATLIPSRKLPLNKIRYHNCMDISDDDFADEITRMDWIMFSSIRVRDLIRDVALSSKQKGAYKSLVNVNRAVNHFNHVACWVTNMVLMRGKPKHRALMLEKFMRIAWKLRQLNNYSGLAAIMAGLQSSPVSRLTQTQLLVTEDTRKKYMTLEILMGSQKSHFAYRLAWENSPLPRIPYLPLHRRDLVSAEEGSKTFIGEDDQLINWKKFEVLGDIVLPIMKSQAIPYSDLERHDIARELILDCRLCVDEEVRLPKQLARQLQRT
jgi:hypothetical protein